MNAADRALTDIITWHKYHPPEWVMDRIQQALEEKAQRPQLEARAQIYRVARAWAGCRR